VTFIEYLELLKIRDSGKQRGEVIGFKD